MSASASLTDSHAHLNSKELREQVGDVLARAAEAGVARVMTVSTELGDFAEVLELASRHEALWAAVGVHPHEAASYTEAHEAGLRAVAGHPKLLALGEMGLDYHYDNSPRDRQREVFERQVALAAELGLPVVIHTREAEEDTAAILANAPRLPVPGVLHCFTSSRWLAERCLDLGFLISFSGILTYPSARELQDVARDVPGDRLLVETDSPYLSPVPHRRSWPNEPARVRHTAAFLAELRGEPLEELAARTTANFERVFPRRDR